VVTIGPTEDAGRFATGAGLRAEERGRVDLHPLHLRRGDRLSAEEQPRERLQPAVALATVEGRRLLAVPYGTTFTGAP
jgi:hypothetical protein